MQRLARVEAVEVLGLLPAPPRAHDAHVEGPGGACHGLADPAEADDGHGCVAQLAHLEQLPVALSLLGAELVETPAQGEEQGEDVLRDPWGEDAPHRRDRDVRVRVCRYR